MSFIANETAYENAIARNIKINARKGRMDRFLATTDGHRVCDFLFSQGEFCNTFSADGRFEALHPVVKAALGDFYTKMANSLSEWGGLTEGQTKAVLGMITRAEAKVAGFAAKRAEEAATSQWIGTVGQRRDFTLTIRHIVEMEGIYGYSYLHILNDDAGNVVIYKGTKLMGDRGERLTVKATIKEHGEREGVKQTKIARPA
jgi:hypothetical protein